VALPRLMLVAGGDDAYELESIVHQAYAGGLRLWQVREKPFLSERSTKVLQTIRHLCPKLTVLVNSDDGAARALSAGLHLPEIAPLPTDWPRARLWGRAVHGVESACCAVAEGAHYLLLGTVFPTPSKPGHAGAGSARVQQVAARVGIPIFAIGGIDRGNIGEVIRAGAHGVAVRRAILEAASPRDATAALVDALTDSQGAGLARGKSEPTAR
jgi:thiamine-phosphate diphosphorylase